MNDGPSNLMRLLVSGLPAAGKTTFLAALWQIFETDGFLSELRLDSYVDDQRYIIEINRAWASCEKLDRTRIESPGVVRVRLRAKDAQIELEVPDLSGELFRDHWVDRSWSAEFDQQVKAADGIILMASTLTKESTLLREVDAAIPQGSEADDSTPEVNEERPDQPEAEVSEALREWDARRTEAQVQLVEHLQFVQRSRSGQPIPVAVLLCAWDQVLAVAPQTAPREWLSQRLPLLDQYLEVNSRDFPSTVFGISAQGGDLDEKDRLLAMRPVDRLLVADGASSSHDLTVPLAWVLDTVANA